MITRYWCFKTGCGKKVYHEKKNIFRCTECNKKYTTNQLRKDGQYK